jgi:hypothetical protein
MTVAESSPNEWGQSEQCKTWNYHIFQEQTKSQMYAVYKQQNTSGRKNYKWHINMMLFKLEENNL